MQVILSSCVLVFPSYLPVRGLPARLAVFFFPSLGGSCDLSSHVGLTSGGELIFDDLDETAME